jgi:hypothetical protein
MRSSLIRYSSIRHHQRRWCHLRPSLPCYIAREVLTNATGVSAAVVCVIRTGICVCVCVMFSSRGGCCHDPPCATLQYHQASIRFDSCGNLRGTFVHYVHDVSQRGNATQRNASVAVVCIYVDENQCAPTWTLFLLLFFLTRFSALRCTYRIHQYHRPLAKISSAQLGLFPVSYKR